MALKRLLSIGIIIGLVGCQAENLEIDEKQSNLTRTTGAAASLSEAEYDALTPEQQYQVANKLSATLYKGTPVSEFFDLGHGINKLKVDGGKDYLTETRESLSERLPNKESYSNAIKARHEFSNESRTIRAEPLATIREYPISRDLFEAWMAYTLANTILFSPAEEIDSADHIDVQRIYDGLLKAMSQDGSIRDIILAHQKSQANWRRFRSPEDNTREMIEIYLGLFDRDADVPKASIACQNWSLTGDDDGYQLVIDQSEANTEPQNVLGQYWVTSCEDFYEVIASHPLVIPRITTFLVDRFYPNFSSGKRAAIVKDIVATNPVRFHDIFLPIIFSKEYLLYNEKPKSFEETFFNLAERTQWENTGRFLNQLVDEDFGASYPTLSKMGQPAMRLKLGRFKDQPLDSLSFASYHEAVRDRVLVCNVTRSNETWGCWGSNFSSKGDFFDLEEYIQYLFISATSRKASTQELNTLISVIEAENKTSNNDQAKIVLDYISRLPEIYFYNTINLGDNP